MEKLRLGQSDLVVSRIALGCLRLSARTTSEAAAALGAALEGGIDFFDHADIYGGGQSEVRFREAMAILGVPRRSYYLQGKCGIRTGYYDSSYEHIIEAVEGSLRRLGTDYLDVLLLHRPDALMEPGEVARAFADLKQSGKVRWFGVSNHSASKLALTFSKVTIQSGPIVNQLQLSLDHADLLSAELTVNHRAGAGSDQSGSVLDYCREAKITVQAWSPLQTDRADASFIGSPDRPRLNTRLDEIARDHGAAPEAVAIAWLLRHPQGIQPITGTLTPTRIAAIGKAPELALSREEWYSLYLAAGKPLP